MPAKPAWYSHLPDIVSQLQANPRPFIDRATLESLLGIGPRRAQQILAPCVIFRIGRNGLADRETLIARLQALVDRDDGQYEIRRRQNVGQTIRRFQQQFLQTPRLLVEAPAEVIQQELANLPSGVEIRPGTVTVTFENPKQCLEKLLALAMAIGNDFDLFEKTVSPPLSP